jgi:hypothetical protein
MVELDKLPEQMPFHNEWAISSDFCRVIDKFPYYSGVVLEDGERVNLGFLKSEGFEPVVSWKTYIKGLFYAVLKSKLANTYAPQNLELNINERITQGIEKLFTEEFRSISAVSYSGSSEEKMRELQEEDSQK